MVPKTPPELQEAYRLIKAGQRQEASAQLKAYLAIYPKDADAWWLMAHAAGKPEIVQKCLERVLQINPNHAKAREKLTKMTGQDAAQPAAAPSPIVPLIPKAPPSPIFKQETAAPDSFEAFAAQPLSGGDNPFEIDPTAPPKPIREQGLAFVQPEPIQIPAPGERPAPPRPKKGGATPAPQNDLWDVPDPKKNGVEKIIGIAVVSIAVVVLIGVVLYLTGSLDGKKEKKVKMVSMDGSSFTIQYPQGYDMRCETEARGYPVCGVANDPYYNDVDWYAHHSVDLSAMTEELSKSLTLFGSDLPPRKISIVVMDVPESSASYDSKSLAKTNYEYSQQGWMLSSKGRATYDHTERTIDGHKAYYYHYYSSDPMWKIRTAAYDVYIQHDGLILWMVISISTPYDEKVPDSMIQDIIRSIDIK